LFLAVGVFVLGLGGVGYTFTGAPQVVGKTSDEVMAALKGPGAAAGADQAPATPTREQIEALVAKLAERMQSRPDDAEGWLMLARSQMMLGRLPEALTAFEHLAKLRPDDANTLVDYADALAIKNGRTLEGEPLQLIQRALKLEPDNLKALVLAGSAAFNRQDDVMAVFYWDRAVSIGPPEHEIVQMARDGAAAARERSKVPVAAGAAVAGPAGMVTKPAAPGVAPPAAPAIAGTGVAPTAVAAAASAVSGTVRLSAQLKAQAAPEDSVFIFARPADGSRMPLAILRKQVKDLPLNFTLDDSLAMSPAARLSLAQQVIVGARISKSGQAMPQPGDLQGLSAPVKVGTTGLVVEISSAVP
jgi:cytochrome c-type biogenesis protein CcmH